MHYAVCRPVPCHRSPAWKVCIADRKDVCSQTAVAFTEKVNSRKVYSLVGTDTWVLRIWKYTCHFQSLSLCTCAVMDAFTDGFVCAVISDVLDYYLL